MISNLHLVVFHMLMILAPSNFDRGGVGILEAIRVTKLRLLQTPNK